MSTQITTPDMQLQSASTSTFNLFNNDTIKSMMLVAEQFSKAGEIIPKRFQDNPAACFVGMQMAARMDIDPFMVLQNLYVVHGTPGFSAKFLIALAGRAGVIGPIEFAVTGKGDSLSVTATAELKATGNKVSATADMAMAKAEGWTTNAKYKSMPAQMLSYRSACMLIRLYSPAATLGMHSVEELELHGEMRQASGRVIPDKVPEKAEINNAKPKADPKPEPKAEPKPKVTVSPSTMLKQLCANAGVTEMMFVAWANANGQDIPEGGYVDINDMEDSKINKALQGWNKIKPLVQDYQSAAIEAEQAELPVN